MDNKPAQDQPEGKIERQLLPLLPSPEKPGPKSDDPEMPEPLAFSTDDPGSEPDAVVTGLVDDVVGTVDPGLYPAVELKDEIVHHTHHCNKNNSFMLLECKINNFTSLVKTWMMPGHRFLSLQTGDASTISQSTTLKILELI